MFLNNLRMRRPRYRPLRWSWRQPKDRDVESAIQKTKSDGKKYGINIFEYSDEYVVSTRERFDCSWMAAMTVSAMVTLFRLGWVRMSLWWCQTFDQCGWWNYCCRWACDCEPGSPHHCLCHGDVERSLADINRKYNLRILFWSHPVILPRWTWFIFKPYFDLGQSYDRDGPRFIF